jgi:hypothetical protein
MKNRVMAALILGTLLLSTSEPTLAAGKLGGAAGGFRSTCSVQTAGKMGGAAGGFERYADTTVGDDVGVTIGAGLDHCRDALPSGTV